MTEQTQTPQDIRTKQRTAEQELQALNKRVPELPRELDDVRERMKQARLDAARNGEDIAAALQPLQEELSAIYGEMDTLGERIWAKKLEANSLESAYYSASMEILNPRIVEEQQKLPALKQAANIANGDLADQQERVGGLVNAHDSNRRARKSVEEIIAELEKQGPGRHFTGYLDNR